jgi:PAS domain-containing protein
VPSRSAKKEEAMGRPFASPEQETWLGLIPLPAFILAADGPPVAANPAWATMLASDGDRWLDVVEPPFRPALEARLRLAVATGEPGSADCQVTGPRGGRWSRWWWGPVPPQSLIVCVGVIDDGQASALPGRDDTPDPPAPALLLN